MQKVRGSSPRRSTIKSVCAGEFGLVEGHSFSVRPPVSSRASRVVVGRTFELEAISAAIESSLDALVGICLEGEPGIGKTTLLSAAVEMATERGMTPIRVTADEEIRGPLLLARAVFDNPQ